MPATHPFPPERAATMQVVRAPSPGDGVGHALRRSFGRPEDLPADWQALLRRIDLLAHC